MNGHPSTNSFSHPSKTKKFTHTVKSLLSCGHGNQFALVIRLRQILHYLNQNFLTEITFK